MPHGETELRPPLAEYVAARQKEHACILPLRRQLLGKLAGFIRDDFLAGGNSRLVFICTHNSRRSHLAQVWAQTAAAAYDVKEVACYSGGTEATACNPRTVTALQRAGFAVDVAQGENPRYHVSYSAKSPAVICFSKLFDHPDNPSSDFAAVMTCSAADAACPLVPGASARFAITYDDPKTADGSPDEKKVYDARCRQIAREMLFCFAQLY